MSQLSYSNRTAILAIVDRLKKEAPVADETLIRAVSGFLLAHRERAGFEHALTRDAVALCNHLRTSSSREVRDTARAALRYLLEEEDFIRDCLPVLGLQDDAYVLSLAIHEISSLTGASVNYGAPDLTGEEKEAADRKLLDFVDRPFCSDAELTCRAREFCSQIESVAESGYFGRMCRNAELLVSTLQSPSNSSSTVALSGKGWNRRFWCLRRVCPSGGSGM